MNDRVTKKYKFPPRMRRLCARYLDKHYPAEREELLRRAEKIYA